MNARKKNKFTRIIGKVILWILIIFLVVSGILYLVAYFYGNDLVRDYLVKTVKAESKGLYSAEIKSLSISPLTGSITIRGFSLVPDTALYNERSKTDTLAPILAEMHIRKFSVRGWNIRSTLLDKELIIGSILLDSPDVTVITKRVTAKKEKKETNPRMLSIPLPKGWKSIRVKKIDLQKGKLTLLDQTKYPADTFRVPSLNVRFTNVLVDSVHQGLRRILNTDDITLTVGDIGMKTKNGMYAIHTGEVGFSTGSEHIWIKDLKIKPEYSSYDFSRKLGYQMDRMDIEIKNLDLYRIDLRQLIIYRKLIAGLVLIDGLNLDDYRDKRVPMRTGFYPKMPHRAILDAKMFLHIDSVKLKNGYFRYSEQVGPEPGSLFFDKADIVATGITNDSLLVAGNAVMEVRGKLFLMGKGELNATLKFPLGEKNDAFTFSGTLGSMDFGEINPMLTKMAPAEITAGRIDRLVIHPVKADNDKATGNLDLYYHGLQLKLESKKEDGWSKTKAGVLGWAANVYVHNDNPSQNGKFRPGIIYFNRDKEKSIFNFLWKSTFSGLKSTMGINTDEQKEIKKAGKEKKKKADRGK